MDVIPLCVEYVEYHNADQSWKGYILFFERKFSCQALHAQSGEKMIGNAEFRSLCEELRVHWVVGLVVLCECRQLMGQFPAAAGRAVALLQSDQARPRLPIHVASSSRANCRHPFPHQSCCQARTVRERLATTTATYLDKPPQKDCYAAPELQDSQQINSF